MPQILIIVVIGICEAWILSLFILVFRNFQFVLFSRGLRLDERVVLQELARLTPGYVGADLKALSREAASCAVNRAVNGYIIR